VRSFSWQARSTLLLPPRLINGFVGWSRASPLRSDGGRIPLPMRQQTFVTSQKRSLEVPGQSHQSLSRRAKLAHGPPKPADVLALKHWHLLAQQPAEEWDAFRQNFARSPNAALLLLGGRWRPRASAGQSESLIGQFLKTRDFQAPIRHHSIRDHTPGVPATRT